MAKTRKAFKSKDLVGLETAAEEYRTSKDCFPDGHSKLACFYDALSELAENAPDAQWTTHIQELASWVKEHPDSITARIAIAQTWINFAWKARGHEYADSVKDQGWQLFGQRTSAAHAILKEAAKLKSKCPMYWFAMQRIALNEGWPNADYDALFQQAIKENPGVFSYHFSKINYLMPRWYGKEGDWEAFADDAANKVGGDDGDVLYARLVWEMKQKRVYDRIYEQAKISWKRAKHGFEVLHERYPQSLSITSEYCVESGLMKEKPQMQVLFNELGGRVDMSIWFDQGRFEAFRDWAFDK